MNLPVSPLFVKNYNSTKRHTVNRGGTRCFGAGQLVITINGSKAISTLIPGERVLSNIDGKDLFKVITHVHSLKNSKKTIKIKLKNGHEIIVTEDHEFFFEGGWHSIKHLLSLWDDRNRNLEVNT